LPGEIQNVPPQPIAFGKYTLLERISHGGMAEVFRAKTRGTAGFERIVAIKLLLPQVADDADFVTMLIDEAKIAGQLSHANIAQIFDLGQVEGRYYIVQEYVPGRDLRAICHHLDDRHTRMGVAQACHVVLKVCEALDYAHNKRDPAGQPLNLVHRDISPQNVIVSHEGEVKLIDFGIVKAEGRATKTLAGLVKGKFAYMSPEQIRGLPVDRRSDVFACGIIMHELLTGRPLFKRSSEFETLQRARVGEIEPPSRYNPDVSPDLDRVVLRALARHVDDRYQSAIALRDDLWEVVRTSGYYQSRDQLAAWMLETFGEPSIADIEAASSSVDRAPPVPQPPRPPAPTPARPPDEDDDGENMTMVDPELASRLHLVGEDSDTVASVVARLASPGPDPAESGPVPAVRALAHAAQSEPDRAVFRTGADALARGVDPSIELGLLPVRKQRAAGEEDETTNARLARARRTKPGPGSPSSWVEPQTPTRRRSAVPESGGDEDSGEHTDDDIGVTMEAPQGASLGVLPLAAPAPQSHPEARTMLGLSPEDEAALAAQPYPPIYPAEPGFPALSGPMHGGLPGPLHGNPPGPLPMHAAPPMMPGAGMGPPHEAYDAYGRPSSGLWQPDPGQFGFEPVPDLRASTGRYWVAAAIAVLVAALTISIVLAVTGG
jgi:eukaryotic-like serine/threonine-protein kinase